MVEHNLFIPFAPEHIEDPEIVQHERAWESFLEKCYDSEWHQQLKNDPVFIKERQTHKKT